MRSFFDWFGTRPANCEHPWLVLGKGPSFSHRHDFDIERFNTIAINDAVREQAVLLAHAIDLDVLDRAGQAIQDHAEYLVMPWIPHVDCAPGTDDLAEHAARHPVLRKLDSQDRLLWYDLSTGANRRHGDAPVIPVCFFSAEACIGLLAAAGARTIRSLGVDGGTRYSPAFVDLSDKTLLGNTRDSFDGQFDVIAQVLLATGVDFAPLDVESPIRVFVGAREEQQVSVRVLEYSIRRFASMSVEVTSLDDVGIAIPEPRDPESRQRTPFSFQRFLIPEATGRRGRALYLDSDMLVFDDIRRLWTLPFGESHLLAVPSPPGSPRPSQFSVMLLDCARLDWKIGELVADLDAGRIDYDALVAGMSIVPELGLEIDPAWNSLEAWDPETTSLLHYTDMHIQPWVHLPHPLGWLWCQDLIAAVDAGFVSLDLLREHAARGFVRPSLVLQVEEHIDDPNSLSLAARRLDRDFVAPWRKLPGATRRRVGRRLDVLAAGLRARLHPGLKRQQRHRARHGSLRSNYDRPFRAALADL